MIYAELDENGTPTIAARCERARTAFNAVDHAMGDEVTDLCDLIADLLHLADSIALDPDDALASESNGDYVARCATMHYVAERDDD